MSDLQKIREVEVSWRLMMIKAAMTVFAEYSKKPKIPYSCWLLIEKKKAEATLSKIRGAE